MGRGPKPTKGKAKPAVSRQPPKSDDARVRDLEKRLAESLEREKAAGAILRVISSSPASVQPTFAAIARAAMSLCEADIGGLFRFDGQLIHMGAFHGTPEEVEASRRAFPQRPGHGSVTARAILAATVVQIDDVSKDPEAADALRAFRTVLSVPMIRDGRSLGAITVARRVVRRFSDEQIELVKIFADQAVIAIENVRLFNETKEALEQQTATAEILRVIASSPTDIQPVLDAVAQNAARVCGADDALIYRVDGDVYRRVAHHGPIAETAAFERRLSRDSMSGRAAVDRRTIHVPDIEAEPRDDLSETRRLARLVGARTHLAAPLIREGAAIGAILIRCLEVRPFTSKQISLLETFADQAVIAIENVRLFTELQEKNRALTQAHGQVTEALEQQTATAEILRVISGSPTDVQPVFDAIVRTGAHLCRADYGFLARYDGASMAIVAHSGATSQEIETVLRVYPMAPTPDSLGGRTILERAVIHIPDVRSDPTYGPRVIQDAGWRTGLGVPLLREGAAIGLVGMWRRDVSPFSDRQIELLKTFADQAVIAIENVRLFTELQASNRELTTALDTQTATSDILRVISRSQTDVQPVFDAIVQSAVRLLQGYSGGVTQVVGDQIHLATITSTDPVGDAAVRAAYPCAVDSEDSNARVVRSRVPLNIADAQVDLARPESYRAFAHARGFRGQVIVPLLRHGEAVGTIGVTRREARAFTDDEIALLQTFADQAVIAIENARLLTELQARTQELSRSVEQLTALGEVGRAVSSSLDLETVLTTIVSRAVELSGLDGGVVFEYDEDAEEFVQRAQTETGSALAEARRTNRIRKGEGVLGQTAITLESVQVSDITLPGAYAGRLRENLIESGIRAILAVPMVYEGRLIGCLGVTRNQPGNFPNETIELLRTFATQSALAIQNARLFHEIEDKSRQLEAASRHKSEFLANMSHELRTPLNAIIGFSEVLSERMFGELNEKQEEYLKDIHASGQHLLSLINDILDLSKIEAGRMELELVDFHLPTAIDNALTLVRERAGRRGIALHQAADEGLGQIRGDERKIKQVLLNLLSNAIKFTPDGGRIEVRAIPVDGSAEVSVTDTGVGIAPEDQEAIFEEFRQVGTADKKVEGTGLGLALSRKFVELHGGRIGVQSQVGAGSTFTFTIPIRTGA